MYKYIGVILAFLFFIGFAMSATTSDFEKITVGNIEYFTTKDLNTSDYVVGSDKIFYGSKTGNVRLKIFLSEKDAIGTRNFRVGVVSHGSLIKITEVSVDGSSTIIQNAQRNRTLEGAPDFWDGKDEMGNIVPNGVYLYRVDVDSGNPHFGKVIVMQ